jgi:hypothetical protein
MTDKEAQDAAIEENKRLVAEFTWVKGSTVECVEDEDDDDGLKDGDYFAQSGDEINFRVVDGEHEYVTRPDEQIHKAGRLYFEKLWYYRCYLHQVDQFERGLTPCVDDKAEAAAEKLRQEFGRAELEGPYTDVEWGMILGKVSALGWVMGEEWDSLDT